MSMPSSPESSHGLFFVHVCVLINLFFLWIFKKLFILYWGVAINNVVIVSGAQQRDSTVHVHAPKLPLPPPVQDATQP